MESAIRVVEHDTEGLDWFFVEWVEGKTRYNYLNREVKSDALAHVEWKHGAGFHSEAPTLAKESGSDGLLLIQKDSQGNPPDVLIVRFLKSADGGFADVGRAVFSIAK